MLNLYTVVGIVQVTELVNGVLTEKECNFQHVVQADSEDEVDDKVLDYYFEKSGDISYSVVEISIFDFIK